jgi:hypothetical protein
MAEHRLARRAVRGCSDCFAWKSEVGAIDEAPADSV